MIAYVMLRISRLPSGLIITPPSPSKGGYEREGENIMASRRQATARVLMPVMIELFQRLKGGFLLLIQRLQL